jgi:hypothetical protein
VSGSNFASSYVCQQLLTTFSNTLNSKSPWAGKNPDQKAVLDRKFTLVMPELKSKSQIGGTDQVKTFLDENKISLELPNEIGELDVCAAVILTILSKWKTEGFEVKIKKDNTEYDGACLSTVICKNPEGFMYASIPLVGGDLVIFEQKTTESSSILEMEQNGLLFAGYTKDTNHYQHGYNGIIFPQVDLDVKRDMVEIIGVKTSNPDYVLTIAKGRCQLQMNHIGAKLKIAMGGVATSTSLSRPKYWTIDNTFCVHFVRNGEVYASVLITPEHFHKVEINFD